MAKSGIRLVAKKKGKSSKIKVCFAPVNDGESWPQPGFEQREYPPIWNLGNGKSDRADNDEAAAKKKKEKGTKKRKKAGSCGDDSD